MPSHQEPAPGSKSAKFVAADPLDPMIRPFRRQGEEEVVEEQVHNKNGPVRIIFWCHSARPDFDDGEESVLAETYRFS